MKLILKIRSSSIHFSCLVSHVDIPNNHQGFHIYALFNSLKKKKKNYIIICRKVEKNFYTQYYNFYSVILNYNSDGDSIKITMTIIHMLIGSCKKFQAHYYCLLFSSSLSWGTLYKVPTAKGIFHPHLFGQQHIIIKMCA